ncbi:MAG: hypothetical protein AAGA64_08665 [Bacteroidota bacterium]
MARKNFNPANKTKSARSDTVGASILDIALGETDKEKDDNHPLDDKTDVAAAEKEEKKAQEKSVEVIVKKETKTKTESSKKIITEDRRRSSDVKKPFSTILRTSLQEDLHQTLENYRQKKNYKYNMSQFMDDAVTGQLKKLKKELNDR